jgi:RNA polymerase sigma-70 factor (ECF subfamily)
MDASEHALIEAALGGDVAAFEEMIRLYSRRLFAVAYGVLQNAGEAEDVVQDVFLRAFEARKRPKEPEKVSPWLVTITRNRACDILRRRRSVPLPDEAHEIQDDRIEEPGDALDASELKNRVHGVLATLPEHYRVALTLRYLEGLDCRSIETVMGLSNGALRGVLGRALETMRRALKPAAELREG